MLDPVRKLDVDLSTLDLMVMSKVNLTYYNGETFYLLRSFKADDPAPKHFNTHVLVHLEATSWVVREFTDILPAVGVTSVAALCDLIRPGNPTPVFTSSRPFHVRRGIFVEGCIISAPPDEVFSVPGIAGADEQYETAERELVTKVCFPRGVQGLITPLP